MSVRMRLRGHLNRKEIDFEETEDCIAYHHDGMPVRCYFDAEGEMTKIEFHEGDDLIDVELDEAKRNSV